MTYKIKQFTGKLRPYNKMSKEDLALMWKVSREQGDKKEEEKILKIYKRKFKK